MSDEGPTLFAAVRKHLNALVRDATDNLTDDPDDADAYRQRLKGYAKVRKVLPVRRKRSRRKVVASTRNKLGIVVPKKQYQPLEKKDSFERWNYEPTEAQVKKFVASAKLPGTALKLGHDLWIFPKFREQSIALLERAYAALGRKVLSAQLEKAIAWRATCDARKK